jgi:hypothetical protein
MNKGGETMLKRSSLIVLALMFVVSMADLGERAAYGQTFRRQGRRQARASRQTGRNDAQAFGNSGYGAYNPYYAPRGYYNNGGYGPGYGPLDYYGAPGSSAIGPGYNGVMPYSAGRYPAGQAYGRMNSGASRAYLGISMSEAADGVVRVSRVRPNSPADEAGLRPGDVILALDGREVYASQDVTQIVARHSPGDAVEIAIDRYGRNDRIEATLGNPTGQFAGRAMPGAGFEENRAAPFYNRQGPATSRQARRSRNATLDPNLYDGFNGY